MKKSWKSPLSLDGKMTKSTLASRQTALFILAKVIHKNQNLDETFDQQTQAFDSRDKAFIRMLVSTCLRRLGQIDNLISKALTKPLPLRAQKAMDILRLGVTQLVFMETPEHAALSTSVDLAKTSEASFYARLINGVLRTIQRQKEAWLKAQNDNQLNTPKWMWQAWVKSYGQDVADKIAQANLNEPAIDISVKENPALWAEKLNGTVLETASIRLPANVYIPNLPGFAQGAWWVQDAAAALPVRLMGNVQGLKVADLCAAPGGKTAGLAAKGAIVDAFDISKNRMKRVEENLNRLQLKATLFVKDATLVKDEKKYDKILIDAPCSATGTLRRHPDIYVHRTPQDIEKLNKAQYALLQAAYRLLKDDGEVVYCTCSLQQEEGEHIIHQVSDLFERVPIEDEKLALYKTPLGDIRTFPFQGCDGFFMTKLRKKK